MAKERVERFGVSLSPRLLEKFDEVIREKGYTNRSEAIRDLMRDFIVSSEWEKDGDVVGALTLVYDHHVRGVTDKLTALQHEHHTNVVSGMHVHLDEHNCMEFLVLRGPAKEVRRVADSLISARGVKHGKLVSSTIGKDVC
jgi:CopG family nickel-responsive transcriptional regulator